MAKRRDFYVYVHKDDSGLIFYVGKGTGRRAWSAEDRHEVWKRYVRERLNGRYDVMIVKGDLTEDEALELEGELIAEHGLQLVNWINLGREFDFEALERFHSRRGANRLFLADTKPLELSDPETAVERYRTALDNLRAYMSLILERGLVAELMEGPKSGEPVILDRLTRCLVSHGRLEDARVEADRYFAEYPRDRNTIVGQRILKRLEGQAVRTPRPRASAYSDGKSDMPYRPDLKVPKDQVERNLRGRELERQGFIENAIEFYRANVREEFDGDWPYERLAMIYRRRRDYASEVAILERAVVVFAGLMGRSHRADVPIKLAKFRERLETARQLARGRPTRDL
jgi:hypothetical protein